MEKNLYDVLGVNKTSSAEDIKKAYRKMAMEYHPDRNPDNTEAEAKFKEAASAYDVLSNPEKKSHYDRFGTVSGPGGMYNGGFGGMDMNDIFNHFGDIFGNGGGFQRRQNRGSDLRMKVTLTIEEILKGTKKKIKYKRQEKCSYCNGEGGKNVKNCNICNGTGQRTVVQNTAFGQIRQVTTCQGCGGSGSIIQDKCKHCHGDGTSLKEQTVDIDIPAGVSNGMQLSMDGNGNHIRNGQPGNLYIVIEEIKDSSFSRDHNNIIVEKTISIMDSILGSKIDVKTPHGTIPLTINPGTEHGKVIKIVGKGIPDIQYGLGDLYVKISIKIPISITEDEKEIIEKIRGSKNFEV